MMQPQKMQREDEEGLLEHAAGWQSGGLLIDVGVTERDTCRREVLQAVAKPSFLSLLITPALSGGRWSG